ncbi:bacterio-opsin activator domain-containing protein [Halococcus agarilyticus]|uniref:bacterio-opsin activator domain-containing protein n=1 Tax=Halococcus agarilyticus TaxID=1232219 RepID=UPI000677ADAA|nr:bacterio-opsin activator domain-containing protein [Halococcus agarilyticus]
MRVEPTDEPSLAPSEPPQALVVADATAPLDEFTAALEREHEVRTTVTEAQETSDHLDGIDCVVVGPHPAEDALDAVERIRAARPDVPIVLLYPAATTAANAIRAGADHCIRYDEQAVGEEAAHVGVILDEERRRRQADATATGTTDGTAFVRSAVDALDDVFFVFDPDGEFVEWNATLADVTGYTDAEIATMAPTDFVADADTEAVAGAIDRTVAEGRATVEAELVTKSGEHVPYEFTGALVEDDAGDVLGICGIGRNVTERRQREQELERYETIVETAPVGVFVLDETATILGANATAWSMVGHTGEELVGEPFLTLVEAGVVDEAVVEEYLDAIRELLSSETEKETATMEAEITPPDGEQRTYLVHVSLLPFEAEFRGTVGVFQDITDRKNHEHALEYQAERLETTNRINEIIRDVNQALVRASTREEIEQAVCSNLAGEDAYRFAWIGERRVAEAGVEPREWAGVEDGYLDDRPDPDEGREDHVTAATAIGAGEMQVAQSIADDPAFAPWREAALERGYESAAAIPLVYGGTAYGVLCVYSPRPNAFDETEREVLAELGETIAYAFSAVERRRALVSDTVVELEFALQDRSIFTIDLTARTNCEVTLDGIVERSDGSLVEFVTVTGTDPDTVLDLADEREDIEATLVSEHDGEDGTEAVFRLVSDGSSSTVSLAEQGGVIREGVAAEGEGRLVFELPQDADVRAIVAAITEQYPDTELVAQRERERTGTRGAEFRAALDDALTDRQTEVLETAYLSGFFEWPRPIDGEEIADSLGIAGPTFHEHVRTGEAKLLESYFESEVAGEGERRVE